jgi:hypothetical protein
MNPREHTPSFWWTTTRNLPISLPYDPLVDSLSSSYTPSLAIGSYGNQGKAIGVVLDWGIPCLYHLLDAWTGHMGFSPSGARGLESDLRKHRQIQDMSIGKLGQKKSYPVVLGSPGIQFRLVRAVVGVRRLCMHAPRHGGMASHRQRTPPAVVTQPGFDPMTTHKSTSDSSIRPG